MDDLSGGRAETGLAESAWWIQHIPGRRTGWKLPLPTGLNWFRCGQLDPGRSCVGAPLVAFLLDLRRSGLILDG